MSTSQLGHFTILFASLLLLYGMVPAMGCDPPGEDESVPSTESAPEDNAEHVLSQDSVEILERPGLLGVDGFILRVTASDDMQLPRFSAQMPELPARRAMMVFYLRVPGGEGERFKASGGTAEFLLEDNSRSVGGQVQLSDLRVTTSAHIDGDLLYSSDLWADTPDDFTWQPQTVIVTVTPQEGAPDIPVEAVIICGGTK